MNVVIPSRKNKTAPRSYDEALYKLRHLIENAFPPPPQLRRQSTEAQTSGRSLRLVEDGRVDSKGQTARRPASRLAGANPEFSDGGNMSPTALTPRSGPQQCVCISIRGAIQSDRTRNLRREANR